MSDTNQFISRKFVVFKDIYELQAQNSELLRVTRELADKMENEEAIAAKQQAAQDHQAVQSLRSTVVMLEDEVKSVTARMKGYMQERDMFRRMLQHQASAAEIQAALGSPAAGGQREVLASIEHNPGRRRRPGRRFRELASPDTTPTGTTYAVERKPLKDQADEAIDRRRPLSRAISARISSQLTLATERYGMLDSNFKAAQGRDSTTPEAEPDCAVRKRPNWTFGRSRLSEDLVEAQGIAGESCAARMPTSKPRRTLWKSIQERLSQDKENLTQEESQAQ